VSKNLIPAGRGNCPSHKVAYASRAQAKKSARKHQDKSLGVYRCLDCDWFHLGHKPQRVRNGEIDKDDWLAATTKPKTPTPADIARIAARRRQEPA
jgi:hypothetical protein